MMTMTPATHLTQVLLVHGPAWLCIFRAVVHLHPRFRRRQSPDHLRVRCRRSRHLRYGDAALLRMASARGSTPTWAAVKMLLSHRMLVGVYLGQYCIVTLTWFFLTWFPIYLAQARHMSIMKVGFAAALPALCGGCAGILGGVLSDRLLDGGHSLTFARKAPIMAGMACSLACTGFYKSLE